MDENFKFVFFRFFSSSLGSHTLATPPEGESKKTADCITKQAKPARRGKQEYCGRRATPLTGIAFKRQRGKDSRNRSFFRAFRLSKKNRK